MCSPLFFKAPPLRDKHEVLEDERLHGLKHCSVHLKKLNSDNEHHLKKLSCFDDYGSNRSKGKLICTDAKEIKPDTCIFDVTKSSGMKCDDTAEHKCPGLKDVKPISENLSTKNDNNYCGKHVSNLDVKVCALSTIANDDVKVKVETNKNVNACIPSKHSVTDESVKGSVVTMLEDIKKVKDEINFATDESGKEVTTKTSIDNSSTVSEANMAKTDIHTDKNTRCSAGKTDKIDKSVNEQLKLKACTDKIDISDNRKLNADTEGFTCDSNHATTTHNSNSTNQQEISPAVLNSIEKCSIQAKQALRGNLQMTAMPNTLGLSSGTVSCSQFSEITIPQHVVKKTKDVQNTASRLVFLPSLSGKKFIYKLETSATSSTTVTLSSPSSLTPVISSSSSTPTVSSSSSTSTPVISSSFSSLTPVNKFQVNISSAVPGNTADMTVLNVGEKPKMGYMNKALPNCAQKCRQSPVKAVTFIQESMRDKLKEKISSPKNEMTLHAWKNDGKLLTLSSIKGNITDKLKEKIISPRKGLILYAGSDGKYYVQSTGEVFYHPSHTQSIHHKVGLSFFVHERAIAIKKKSTKESKPVQNVAHTPKCKFPTRTRKKGGMKIHYDDTESSDSSFYSDISANLSSEEEDDLDNEEAESAMVSIKKSFSDLITEINCIIKLKGISVIYV
ncbi:hypothetical protein DPMN_138751 [Dreissena polymorpha]|uniref:Uncharacterized protein n=1 Tax=Dreissena polymorpha TaxID=45954 RepID=A0A9D4G788_DREPO|nr:hypothetical protein DPMN_138751 [Dreissena polymorpha]